MTLTAERVATPAQAALLLDPRLADVLGRLGCGPRSAAALARELNKPLSTIHDQLQRLLAADVIREVSCTRRAGRPVRVYRFDSPWLIPFDATPAATLRELFQGSFETMLRGQLDDLARYMTEQEGDWAIRLEAHEDSVSHAFHRPGYPTEHDPKVPIMGSGASLHLNPERARALRSRLQAILDEYSTSEDAGGEPWSLTVLFTPGSRP